MHPAQSAILVGIQRNEANRRARLEPHLRAVRTRTVGTPRAGLSGMVLRLARRAAELARGATGQAASPAACAVC